MKNYGQCTIVDEIYIRFFSSDKMPKEIGKTILVKMKPFVDEDGIKDDDGIWRIGIVRKDGVNLADTDRTSLYDSLLDWQKYIEKWAVIND